jgi:hypothetical protein
MRGLGFGVGTEKLPSLFASLGPRITATDAPVGQNWDCTSDASDHKSRLFDPDIIDRESFDDRVSFEYCDMNDIPSHLPIELKQVVQLQWQPCGRGWRRLA